MATQVQRHDRKETEQRLICRLTAFTKTLLKGLRPSKLAELQGSVFRARAKWPGAGLAGYGEPCRLALRKQLRGEPLKP